MKRKNRTAHKRLLEKRRRTLKQRGGGDEAATVGEWINRVKMSHVFASKGTYALRELKDPYLALPASSEYSVTFDLNNGQEAENKVDIRQEGAAMKEFLKESIEQLPQLSPMQFKQYISGVRGSAIGDAKDIVDSILFMIRLENKIRKKAGESYPLLDENADGLANDNMYPLFIWALLLNCPDNIEPGFSTTEQELGPLTAPES
jgi:hypothetical protein